MADLPGPASQQAGSVSSTAPAPQEDRFERAIRVETLTNLAPNNAVKAEDLSVFLGGRCLLANTELKIPEVVRTVEVPQAGSAPKLVRRGTCYGLVGPNGCGKSTLLRLIAEGQVPRPAGWEPFLVGQHLPPALPRTVVEEVLSADAQRAALLAAQAELRVELATLVGGTAASDAEAFVRASDKLDEVQRHLAQRECAAQEVERVLVALGFRCRLAQDADLAPVDAGGAGGPGGGGTWSGRPSQRPTVCASMQHLSGGWRMKVELAKALWLKPKLLLLDEPTNHLDFEALRWFEEQLEGYPSTTVIVSHDVSFLHSVCHEIFWMKDLKIESMPRDLVSQEDLARMQRRKGLNFTFAVPVDGSLQHHGVSVHDVEFSHPSDCCNSVPAAPQIKVKGAVRFSTQSRAVMLGRNGSGKSTFLGLCTGALRPTRGMVDRTADCQVGYYSQLMDELEPHGDASAVDFLVATCSDQLHERLDVRAAAAAKAAQRRGSKAKTVSAAVNKRLKEVARGVLSSFGFEGDLAVSVPVGSLSGGQKARLKLAALSLRPSHMLFLDEPTNHLDAEACEALAKGLSEFKGGVVVVTHDDLLIYRLVQCNWAESQLVVARRGEVSCRRDFGGHCLKTLKAEMRRSEAEAPAAGAATRPGSAARGGGAPAAAAGAAGPLRLPPWIAVRGGAARRGALPGKAAPESGGGCAPPAAQDGGSADGVRHEEPEHLASESPMSRVREAFEWPSAECDASPQKGSTHSRLRKDLINLNKAVIKWLAHEEIGVLTRAKLRERIRTSTAARSLCEAHGDRFRREEFECLALDRAIAARMKSSLAQS